MEYIPNRALFWNFQWNKSRAVPFFSIFQWNKPWPHLILAFSMEKTANRTLLLFFNGTNPEP